MILLKTNRDLRKYLDSQMKDGAKLGFVPTMGALHEGHISLIKQARAQSGLAVCSIFINPTQFNDPLDFTKYPVTIDKDIEKLEKADCDVLFLPSVKEIYPGGAVQTRKYEIGYLETVLEGSFRPGHFQGVCQVVHRLLDLVNPNDLYLGQKDYQQCLVIQRLLQLTGLSEIIKLHISPTLREPDGLAMSSRNMRLAPPLRKKANLIFQALDMVRNNITPGNLKSLQDRAAKMLSDNGFRPDYVAIADAKNLTPVNNWDGAQKIVALAAAYLGEVRLIDNMILN
jgi:pantoate--beta-alanine ligase